MRRDANSRLRIVVSGLAGLYPVGGVAWDYLQYVIGLARLGHEVCYHEDAGGQWPYEPVQERRVPTGEYSARFIADFFAAYAPDLTDRWRLRFGDAQFGMEQATFERFAEDADLFLNVSGGVAIPDCLTSRCLKVFLDTDPGYNQIVYLTRPAWSKQVDLWRWTVDAHDVFCTYAECMGAPQNPLPTLERDWVATRMPIVTELWPQTTAPEGAPWTTVMTWNAFQGPLSYNGRKYGSKGWEFAKILDLPRKTHRRLSVAAGGEPPRQQLRDAGWEMLDGPQKTLTPDKYQSFIQGSRGEISTAKNVYVALETGWFSCRSACYLASGRPVVLQDTGFSRVLPDSPAIVPFTDEASAAAALEEVESDYPRRSALARETAAELFGAERVLPRLIDDCFAYRRRPAEVGLA